MELFSDFFWTKGKVSESAHLPPGKIIDAYYCLNSTRINFTILSASDAGLIERKFIKYNAGEDKAIPDNLEYVASLSDHWGRVHIFEEVDNHSHEVK